MFEDAIQGEIIEDLSATVGDFVIWRADDLPAYQLTARLTCKGFSEREGEPVFSAVVALEAVYQQVSGDPVDMAEFTSEHAILARQLYPLLQQQLREQLTRIGLTQFRLPFDLTPGLRAEQGTAIEMPGNIH